MDNKTPQMLPEFVLLQIKLLETAKALSKGEDKEAVLNLISEALDQLANLSQQSKGAA